MGKRITRTNPEVRLPTRQDTMEKSIRRACPGLGPFLGVLPQEILEKLFDYLPPSDIGNLALASRDLKDVVAQWVPSKKCIARSQTQPAHHIIENLLRELRGGNTKINQFSVLCNRMTFLSNTRERLRYAFSLFHKSVTFKRPEQKGVKGSEEWTAFISFIRFMDMVQTFIRGWHKSQFPLVLKELDSQVELVKMYRQVYGSTNLVNNQAGWGKEMALRMWMRCLAWDLAGNNYRHRSAWILAIMDFFLGPRPLTKKAKGQATILSLIFGPSGSATHFESLEGFNELTPNQKFVINEIMNHTNWSVFIEDVANTYHEGKAMFYTLAQVVCSLSPAWESEMSVAVIDELFQIPKPWVSQNRAGFLLFCSEALVTHYLGTKLQKGFDCLVAAQLAQLVLVSQKFDNELSHERGIGKVFDAIIRETKGIEEPGHTAFSTLVWNNFVEDVVQTEEEEEDVESIEMIRSFGAHVMETLTTELGKKEEKCSPRKHALPSGDNESVDQGPKCKKTKMDPYTTDEMELVPSSSDDSDADFQAED